MSTRYRTRTRSVEEDDFTSDLHFDASLEDITDDDIEEFLLEQEEEKNEGFWNLPTVAGMSIIGVGVAYLLQEMGLIIPSFTTVIDTLASALPWFAGILIILLGFGVLGWKPKRKKGKTRNLEKKVKKEVKVEEYTVKPESSKRRLTKSRNKKLAGVAGGLAEYFGVDPTLIRIAFVIATVFGGGFPAIPLYIVLALVMSKPDGSNERPSKKKPEEKIIVIRESP